jgi:hypothetical protein
MCRPRHGTVGVRGAEWKRQPSDRPRGLPTKGANAMSDKTKDEAEDTQGEQYRYNEPASVEAEDTEGSGFRLHEPASVEADDTEGNFKRQK